jgi:DNA-binding MarR family transcriptional regulator
MNDSKNKPANRSRKKGKGFDLDDHLPYRIVVVSNLLALSRDAAIRQVTDLPLRELRVLIDIGNYGPVKAFDIARKSRKDSITVSRAVKGLAAGRLIEHTPDAGDRRSPWLSLTSEGDEIYQRLTALLEQRAEQVQQVLSKQETRQLLDMMRRLEDAAETLVASNALKVLESEGAVSPDHREIIRWHRKSLQEK